MPTNMEVFTANADGSNVKQITNLGKANWAPNWMPDGKRIIFASNHEYPRGFPFEAQSSDSQSQGLSWYCHALSIELLPYLFVFVYI